MSKAIPQRLLRLPEVKHLMGLSKSTIYTRIAEDLFPRQISLGSRTVSDQQLPLKPTLPSYLDIASVNG